MGIVRVSIKFKLSCSTRKQKASQPSRLSVISKRSNTTPDVLESRDELEENTPDTSAISGTGLNASKGLDPNMCCMCLGNFKDDVLDGCEADWLDCACGR